jgi:hypothetical protein
MCVCSVSAQVDLRIRRWRRLECERLVLKTYVIRRCAYEYLWAQLQGKFVLSCVYCKTRIKQSSPKPFVLLILALIWAGVA